MTAQLRSVIYRSLAGFTVALLAWILVRSHLAAVLLLPALVAAFALAARYAPASRAALVASFAARARTAADLVLRPFLPAVTAAIAFALRLGWALHFHVAPTSDYREFHDFAVRLAGGDFYALGQSKSPVTVLVYGAFYRVFGDAPLVTYLIGAALGALQVWLVYAIARRLFASKAPARFAALVLALFPGVITYYGLPDSEVIFFTLLPVMILQVLALARERGGRPRNAAITTAALLGLETAALHLTRNTGVVIGAWVVMAALAWMPKAVSARARLELAAVFVAATAVCLTPQVVYNYTQYGAFSIQSSRYGALNLLSGTNMDSGGRHNRHDAAMARPSHRGGQQDWREVSQRMRETAIARITRDPAGFLWFALTEKFDTMWCDDGYGALLSLRVPGRDDHAVRDAAARWSARSNRYYAGVVVLALAGLCLVLAWGRAGRDYRLFTAIAGGILLATFALHLVIEVQPRYHFVAVFLMPLFAAALVDTPPDDGTDRLLTNTDRVGYSD